MGVSEKNGSVIICTQAGAVWRRIKRPKVKHTFVSGTSDFKSKDYKFQRVPGLTKVAAVRSNTFGGYAAIRKDCDCDENADPRRGPKSVEGRCANVQLARFESFRAS